VTAPIFTLCSADAGLQALLEDASGIFRMFPFGEVPEGESRPYVVFQTVYGSPENYLGNVPDIDSYGIQVDVYAIEASAARDVTIALRDVIEPHAHIVGWSGEMRDPSTRLYRTGFTVDWFVSR
jgi:hypothetical protein